MKEQRNQVLDLMKFGASFLIVCHHFQGNLGGTLSINFVGGRFYYGWIVELFFLISGFLTYHYIVKVQEGQSFPSFFRKKFFRYAPQVAISILLFCGICVIGKWYGNRHGVAISDGGIGNIYLLICTLLNVQEGWCFPDTSFAINPPLWYISVLQFCYILFFGAVVLAKRAKIKPAYIFTFIIVFYLSLSENVTFPFMTHNMGRGVISFFYGLLFAELVARYSFQNRKLKILSAIIVWGGIAIWFLSYDMIGSAAYELIRFLFFPALVYMLSSWKWLRRITDSGSLVRKLGDVSFWIYIVHYPLMYLYRMFYHMATNRIPTISWANIGWFLLMVCVIACVMNLLYNKLISKHVEAYLAKKG